MKAYILSLRKTAKWLLLALVFTCAVMIMTTIIECQRIQNHEEPIFYIDSRLTFLIDPSSLIRKYGITYECVIPNSNVPPEFVEELPSFDWESYFDSISFNIALGYIPKHFGLFINSLHIKTIFIYIPLFCILVAWFKRLTCPVLPSAVSSSIVLFFLLFIWRQELSNDLENALDISCGGYHLINTLQLLTTTLISWLILPLHQCKNRNHIYVSNI